MCVCVHCVSVALRTGRTGKIKRSSCVYMSMCNQTRHLVGKVRKKNNEERRKRGRER
jgi:hypothetical protein